MQHLFEQTPQGLHIEATVAPDRQQAVIVELGKCADGSCHCPSPQYDKVTGVAVCARAGGKLAIDLRVKAGEQLDLGAIEQCLAHTALHAGA